MTRADVEKWARQEALRQYKLIKERSRREVVFKDRRGFSHFSIASFVSGALAAYDQIHQTSAQSDHN